ncbi:MAG: hypothetical protein ACFE9Z_10950 [Promethearchaeota archaeon]
MELELVKNHKNREDLYNSTIIKKQSEIDPAEIQIIKEILILEISG